MILIVFLLFVNSEDIGKIVIMVKVFDIIISWIVSVFVLFDVFGFGVLKFILLKVF